MLNKHKTAQLLLWPWNLGISATATAYALPVASRSQGNSTALLKFPWFHHEKHRRNYEILTLEVVKNTRFVWQVVVVVVEVQFSHLCHLGWITLSLGKVYAVTLFLKFQKCQWLLVEVPTSRWVSVKTERQMYELLSELNGATPGLKPHEG